MKCCIHKNSDILFLPFILCTSFYAVTSLNTHTHTKIWLGYVIRNSLFYLANIIPVYLVPEGQGWWCEQQWGCLAPGLSHARQMLWYCIIAGDLRGAPASTDLLTLNGSAIALSSCLENNAVY